MGNTLRTEAQSWPANGEIDMMENVDDKPQISGTLHCGTATGGPCDEPNGRYGVHQFGAAPSTTGFHTYSVIWDSAAKTLTYQFDGTTFNTVTAAQVGVGTWQQAMSHGYFLLLNVAVGGSWPGQPNSDTVSGASMLVDYVRVSTSS
jgi:beta-glucanase (GH16 family)